MPTSRRGLVFLMALVLAAGSGWIVATRVTEGERAALLPAPQVGHPAPDFTLTAVSGEKVTLSELAGRPVVLNFWATWCPPCRAEMPDLQKAHEEYAETGLVIVAVNQGESAVEVHLFATELGLSFPLLLDPGGEVGTDYLIRALPTSFFIDRESIVRSKFTGPMTTPILEDRLRSILR